MNTPSDPGASIGGRTAASADRYVFIMGRGHSGSTVLDSLLSNLPGCVSIGGIVAGIRQHDAVCSCGEPVPACPFWGPVQATFERRTGIAWSEAADVLERLASLSSFLPTWFARRGFRRIQRGRRVVEGIAAAVREVAEAPTVIDSSKAIPMGLFHARFTDSVRVIHLVRDPERVLGSNLHRMREGLGLYFMGRRLRNRRLTPFYIALGAVAWVVGNLLAEFVARRSDTRVLRVRYEDLCGHAPQELRRIADFIGCGDPGTLIDAIQRGDPLSVGHKSAGNRMRMSGEFVWQPERVGGRPMPGGYRRLVRLLTWPLRIRYGYAS